MLYSGHLFKVGSLIILMFWTGGSAGLWCWSRLKRREESGKEAEVEKVAPAVYICVLL